MDGAGADPVDHRQVLAALEEVLGSRVQELSAQYAQLLAATLAPGRLNAHLLPVNEARARYEADSAAPGPGERVAAIRRHCVQSGDAALEVREFRPSDRVLPAIIYFHGGGWLLGSVDSHQAVCRALANAAGACVFSVGYRRAPESRFPTAVDDCYAAVGWVRSHAAPLGVDPDRLALAGDSAGGNLATVTAILCRDRGGPPPAMQVLVYPVTTTDLELGFDLDYEGFFLYRDEMQWHQGNYLRTPSQRTDPKVSPLDRADLRGLPPALVLTAQCDPLHRQGELYAGALERAGVRVEHRQWPGAVHGFWQLPGLFPEGAEAVQVAARALRRCWQ
jgi:acetyl esterase/lipase